MSSCCNKLSCLCFFLSMASIVGSIAIWYLSKGATPDEVAHAERFGIFVGLWAPTFLGLANYLKGCSAKGCSTKACEEKTGCCKT